MRQITIMTRALSLLVNPGNAISRTTESPASRAMTYDAIVERGVDLSIVEAARYRNYMTYREFAYLFPRRALGISPAYRCFAARGR